MVAAVVVVDKMTGPITTLITTMMIRAAAATVIKWAEGRIIMMTLEA